MINLFLIDDHSYLNQGIVAVFNEQDYGINVVGSATSGEEALKQLRGLDVDLVLLDIIMPEMDGIVCCQLIKKRFPEIKIIAFTGELDPNILLKIWLQGVEGILIKTCGTDELAASIKRVSKGFKIIGNGVPSFLDNCESDIGNAPKLTKTEVEVLKLLGSGLTRKETAEHMNRSMYAVEFHCKNMFKKFNTNRIHTILAEARKARIIK